MNELHERLAGIEAQLKMLVGNGRAGRIELIERQLARHDRFMNRLLGFGLAINLLLVAAEALRLLGRLG